VNDPVGEARAISREVLETAVSYQPGEVPPAEVAALRRRLDAISPSLSTLSGHDADGARMSMADAYMDLDWIESRGLIPMSIRLEIRRRGGGNRA
jgi:hypothetical protein